MNEGGEEEERRRMGDERMGVRKDTEKEKEKEKVGRRGRLAGLGKEGIKNEAWEWD